MNSAIILLLAAAYASICFTAKDPLTLIYTGFCLVLCALGFIASAIEGRKP